MSPQVHSWYLSLFVRWLRWKLQGGVFAVSTKRRIGQKSLQRPLVERILVQWLCSVAIWDKAVGGEGTKANSWVFKPWILTHFHLSPRFWVIFTAHYHKHQREGKGNEGRWNSNESIPPLGNSLARKYTRGRRVSNPLCYSGPWCCQAISSGLYGNDLWDERRKEGGGKLPPAVASSNKRERNYMLSGSLPPRVAQILLNKLMFGSILSAQNWRKRDAETVFRAIIMLRMHWLS